MHSVGIARAVKGDLDPGGRSILPVLAQSREFRRSYNFVDQRLRPGSED